MTDTFSLHHLKHTVKNNSCSAKKEGEKSPRLWQLLIAHTLNISFDSLTAVQSDQCTRWGRVVLLQRIAAVPTTMGSITIVAGSVSSNKMIDIKTATNNWRIIIPWSILHVHAKPIKHTPVEGGWTGVIALAAFDSCSMHSGEIEAPQIRPDYVIRETRNTGTTILENVPLLPFSPGYCNATGLEDYSSD